MKPLMVIALLGAFAIGCQAAGDLSYDVNLSFGANSTLTGDIVTDGALGTLTAADFVDWNLLLANSSDSVSLLGPLSGANSNVQLGGTDVTATPSTINFNFNEVDNGYLIFESIGTPISFVCFGPGTNGCDFTQPGSGIGDEINSSDASRQYTQLSGVQAIASPEPSTFWLAGSALSVLLVSFCISRRRAAVQIPASAGRN